VTCVCLIGLSLLIGTSLYGQSATPAKPTPVQTGWRVDPNPALTRGPAGSWDDQGIGEVSVVRAGNKWLLIYEGLGASETGRRPGFGLATSSDGIGWQKQRDQPVFAPVDSPDDRVAAPSVTRWKDEFWMGYLSVDRSADDSDSGTLSFRLAHSNDGTNWRESLAGKEIPIDSNSLGNDRPCLYSDPQVKALELWWIGAEGNKRALFHSISRDGTSWSNPSTLPASEIDARPILCARVYPSGKFYIIVYVVELPEENGWRIVTKISDNARTWTSKGPPEFSIPMPSAPWMIFTSEGARVFYLAREQSKRDPPDMRTLVRSAFCPKAAYEPR
jgi:hypothetical protein